MAYVEDQSGYPYQDGDDTTEGLGNEDGTLVVVDSTIAQEIAHAA